MLLREGKSREKVELHVVVGCHRERESQKKNLGQERRKVEIEFRLRENGRIEREKVEL
jgi:nicotinamide mononucleotide adenylyltransferase